MPGYPLFTPVSHVGALSAPALCGVAVVAPGRAHHRRSVAQHVGGLLDDLGCGLARAVPRPHLHANEQRVALVRVWLACSKGRERLSRLGKCSDRVQPWVSLVAPQLLTTNACMPAAPPPAPHPAPPTCQVVLQGGNELVGVQRHHPVVVVSSGQHHSCGEGREDWAHDSCNSHSWQICSAPEAVPHSSLAPHLKCGAWAAKGRRHTQRFPH